jgi:hypothetical protein
VRIWTLWVQADEATWLEGAWDDESTAENHDGYLEAVDKAARVAKDNGGEMRVIAIDVPYESVFSAFKVPIVKGQAIGVQRP